MNYDRSKDNFGVRFMVEPRFLPNLQLTDRTGIEVPAGRRLRIGITNSPLVATARGGAEPLTMNDNTTSPMPDPPDNPFQLTSWKQKFAVAGRGIKIARAPGKKFYLSLHRDGARVGRGPCVGPLAHRVVHHRVGRHGGADHRVVEHLDRIPRPSNHPRNQSRHPRRLGRRQRGRLDGRSRRDRVGSVGDRQRALGFFLLRLSVICEFQPPTRTWTRTRPTSWRWQIASTSEKSSS